jgi:hypothetical protein
VAAVRFTAPNIELLRPSTRVEIRYAGGWHEWNEWIYVGSYNYDAGEWLTFEDPDNPLHRVHKAVADFEFWFEWRLV